MKLNTIRKVSAPKIEIEGILGKVQTPGSKYVVHFFSTIASHEQTGSSYHELLKSLKPMREILDANKIDDVKTLLQRDLNDQRISEELVPYLLGKKSPVAFFPAVLGVLLPKDFLSGKHHYPTSKETKLPKEGYDKKTFSNDSGDCWSLDYTSDSKNAILTIHPSKTDLVVLDGQHRTNAFRVVSEDFFEDKNADLYEPFYSKIRATHKKEIESFIADLPVTLIWFEASKINKDTRIEPQVISRRLFVDVNNSAKSVSESRTILLDDYNATAVATQLTYSYIASKSNFQTNSISLLHTGFDVDSDLTSTSPHIFTLTTPQIIYDSLDWLLFGSRRYRGAEYFEVKKQNKKDDTTNCRELIKPFGKFCKKSDSGSSNKTNVIFDYDLARNEGFNHRDPFQETIAKPIRRILNEFLLHKIHFSAAETIEKDAHDWLSDKKQTLEKVFFGGDGLYYAYQNAKSAAPNDIIHSTKNVIKEIESDFNKARREAAKKYSADVSSSELFKSFEAIRSKAFQIALINTYFHLKELNGEKYTDQKYIDSLNSIKLEQWVYILTDLKQLVIKGTDPKKWPAYHKIILRICDQQGKLFYKTVKSRTSSVECKILESIIDSRIEAYATEHEIEFEELSFSKIEEDIPNWKEAALKQVDDHLANCGLKKYANVDYLQIAIDQAKSKCLQED